MIVDPGNAGPTTLAIDIGGTGLKADVLDKARHFALAAGDLAAERMGFVEAVGA